MFSLARKIRLNVTFANKAKNLPYSKSLCDGSGPNVIKLFTVVIYECSQKTRVLVSGRPFQHNLMFVGKVGAYPRMEDLQDASLG